MAAASRSCRSTSSPERLSCTDRLRDFRPVVLKDSVVLVNGGHMPFSEDAVRRSVNGLERSDASVTATFRSGYKEWKSANGGVFTITIPEAVAYVKDTFLAGQRVDQ